MCVRQITCRDLGILSITFPQDKDNRSILWQEARAHDRTNGYCRARKAGGDSLNLALHTAAFGGNPSNRWNGQSRRRESHTRTASHA